MSFYFDRFEDRRPPEPLPHSPMRELAWQFFAVVCIVLGGAYLWWRWTDSINMSALWFSVPVVLAETGAYIGLILWVINLWAVTDRPILAPPATIGECHPDHPDAERAVAIDVMFASYNEDPELVRLGVRDAKAIRYPHNVDLRIHVLDDGRRAEMRTMCEQEGIGYITRSTNEGFKAGNLRNAMEVTSGDFIVICDADTRPFPTFLERTMGYFRDPKVAWVQTPQWFYDLPEGEPFEDVVERRFGLDARKLAERLQHYIGPVQMGADPFVNDPKMFYDILLRRRNWANASFCCGAGSIHRREAIMEAALREFGGRVEERVIDAASEVTIATHEREVSAETAEAIRSEIVTSEILTPYKFHVSEDIYTSIILHSDRERQWTSVLHPYVESKMLSPQDLLTWTIQRFKYAGGSLDILFNDNPLLRKGLTLPQRLMYASTFWSYLGGIWNIVFLLAPIIYLITGIAPIEAYSSEFLIRILPFLISIEIATLLGTWGIAGFKSKAAYLGFFPINLKALWTVISGKKISFPVTPKARQAGRHLRLVWPQIAIVAGSLVAIVYALIMLVSGQGSYTPAGIAANTFWVGNNIIALSVMISAALWRPHTTGEV